MLDVGRKGVTMLVKGVFRCLYYLLSGEEPKVSRASTWLWEVSEKPVEPEKPDAVQKFKDRAMDALSHLPHYHFEALEYECAVFYNKGVTEAIETAISIVENLGIEDD